MAMFLNELKMTFEEMKTVRAESAVLRNCGTV
jgi:hypothetical protein